jgi:hypothetical protein
MNRAETGQFRGIKTVPAVPLVIGPHAHHWLLDTPCGPTCEDVCKLCGERRIFRNSFPELEYEYFRDGHFGALEKMRSPFGFHIEDGKEDDDGTS